jgi:hypothetical protein
MLAAQASGVSVEQLECGCNSCEVTHTKTFQWLLEGSADPRGFVLLRPMKRSGTIDAL